MNEQYKNALQDFTSSADSSKYFIVGSIALLSYTQKHGYDREVHDIDIIMEKAAANAAKEKLISKGYTQNTFINPRMPFYKKLMKHAQTKYLRFTKDNVNIEILATDFTEAKGLLFFEIYPGIKAGFPKTELVTSDFYGVPFKTLSKEMIYIIKSIANNSFGKLVKYKESQRYDDFSQIQKLIDEEKVSKIKDACRLDIFGLRVKVPGFLVRVENK